MHADLEDFAAIRLSSCLCSCEQANLWEDYTEIAKAGTYAFLQTLKKDEHDHGEKFHYATGNTDVVVWLIERASGQRFTEFFTQRVWSKLGANRRR